MSEMIVPRSSTRVLVLRLSRGVEIALDLRLERRYCGRIRR